MFQKTVLLRRVFQMQWVTKTTFSSCQGKFIFKQIVLFRFLCQSQWFTIRSYLPDSGGKLGAPRKNRQTQWFTITSYSSLPDAGGKLGIPSARRRQASRILFSTSGTITGGWPDHIAFLFHLLFISMIWALISVSLHSGCSPSTTTIIENHWTSSHWNRKALATAMILLLRNSCNFVKEKSFDYICKTWFTNITLVGLKKNNLQCVCWRTKVTLVRH